MSLRTPKHRRGISRRVVATTAASLIVLAQLVGALHSHQWARARGETRPLSIAVDSSLCAVCQIASHGQANFTGPTQIDSPTMTAEPTPPTVKLSLVRLLLSSPLGRAPPR
jgi:hypothetical protein